MAAMTADRPGVISWALAIRTTMANDPGRQFLEDQIQRDGFDFLDEYFANILAGPKQDPIIELVKTPGRKKDVPKRTRAATAAAAKAKAIISLSLEDDDGGKENVAPAGQAIPINDFHKTLLQQKQKRDNMDVDTGSHPACQTDGLITESPSHGKTIKGAKQKTVKMMVDDSLKVVPEVTLEQENDEDEEQAVEELVTPPHLRHTDAEMTEEPPLPAISFALPSQHLLPDVPSVQELSVIAEDEEPLERSRQSMETHPPDMSKSKPQTDYADTTHESEAPFRNAQVESPVISNVEHDLTHMSTTSDRISTSHTFDSIPLDSPQNTNTYSTDEFMTAPLPPSSTMQVAAMLEDYTVPLEAPLPHATLLEDTSSSKTLGHKKSLSQLHNIGAPSPLRKSIRAPPEQSLVAPAAVTPAPLNHATRSSWLVKAREVKAKEEYAKRGSTLEIGPSPSTFVGLKRKSGDSFAEDADQQTSERKTKVPKTSEENIHVIEMRDASQSRAAGSSSKTVADFLQHIREQEAVAENAPDGMMDRLKKTVEGLSARVGKSMGKSLGGAAAQALADARAAAEAKIAGRHNVDTQLNGAHDLTEPEAIPESVFKPDAPAVVAAKEVKIVRSVPQPEQVQSSSARLSKEALKRLSVSDLVVAFETKKVTTEPPKVFQPPPPLTSHPATFSKEAKKPAETSTSTTPPNSPPHISSIFSAPQHYKPQLTSTFSLPPAAQALPLHGLLFQPQAFSGPRHLAPQGSQLTYASTQSTFSDALFENEAPTWLPSTQDTEYTDIANSQSSQKRFTYEEAEFEKNLDMEPETEGDESWHMDERFASGPIWTVGMGAKDDSMTWSTLPTQSSNGKGETGPLRIVVEPTRETGSSKGKEPDHALDDIDVEKEPPEVELDMDVEEEVVFEESQPELPKSQSTVSLVNSQNNQMHTRSNSQASVASSQMGFLSTASKLVSSVLGGSKKGKGEPVKSLQLAAAAARKQQEETDKKAIRLKEMEARRQQAAQKKAEDEKAREEKKIKEDKERRKRDKEKDEHTEKKLLRMPSKKILQPEQDNTKQRKVTPENDKKVDAQKPPSKDTKDMSKSRIGKPAFNSSQAAPGITKPTKQPKAAPTTAAGSSATIKLVASVNEQRVETTTVMPIASSMKGKGKAKAAPVEDELTLPSKTVQSQMQARYEAQLAEIRKAEQEPPAMPTENIELPDINSEYSDSEDEDRVKTFDPPDWAQSPDLREALHLQSTVNPDDIFGAIKPLRMEELFKTRTSRFRARTSSANWAGADAVTFAEERAYAKRMGYTS